MAASAWTPPLCAKDDDPTYGRRVSLRRFAISSTNRERSRSFLRLPAQESSRPILRERLGIIVHRLALPFLSPMPLRVPCTIDAPFSTPRSDSATPRPESLWQWTPTGVSPINSAVLRTISENAPIIVPPFVSHRQTHSAPPRFAAASVSRAYSGLSANPSK